MDSKTQTFRSSVLYRMRHESRIRQDALLNIKYGLMYLGKNEWVPAPEVDIFERIQTSAENLGRDQQLTLGDFENAD